MPISYQLDSSSTRQQEAAALLMPVCCLLIFISVAITMGFLFIDFASNWPEWGPGPHPALFTWIPFAMAGFGVLALISTIIRFFKNGKTSDSSIKYASTVDTFSAEEVSTYEANGYTAPTYIRTVPNFCNNCGSEIDEQSVQWIDSMTFTCPYCGEKQKAGRKPI